MPEMILIERSRKWMGLEMNDERHEAIREHWSYATRIIDRSRGSAEERQNALKFIDDDVSDLLETLSREREQTLSLLDALRDWSLKRQTWLDGADEDFGAQEVVYDHASDALADALAAYESAHASEVAP